MAVLLNATVEYPVNPQSGTSYTVTANDSNTLVTFSNGSAIAVTLPVGSALPTGFVVFIENRGVGAVTLTPTTSNIDGASSLVISQNQGILLFVNNGTGGDNNYYTMRGSGAAAPAAGGVNHQTGTTYTVSSSDNTKLVTFNNAASVAVTLPAASGMPSGFYFSTEDLGAGSVTFTPASGTIDGSVSLTINTNQGIFIYSDGSNYFSVRGMGGSGSSGFSTGVNIQTGTTYTVVAGDNAKLITFANASPVAVTVPIASSLPTNFACAIENRGPGQVTLTPTTSTIDGAASLVLSAGQGVLIYSDGTNYFTMRGMASNTVAYVFAGPPDAPPATPTAFDDEFNENSLSVQWTPVNQGPSTIAVSEGRLQIRNPQSSTNNACLIVEVPPGSTPWEFTSKVSLDSIGEADSYAGIAVQDGGGQFVALTITDQGAPSSAATTEGWQALHYTAPSAVPSSVALGPYSNNGSVYVRVRNDGTNLIFSISRDGLQFIQVYSEAVGSFLATITGIGLVVDNSGNVSDAVLSSDWIRNTTGGYTPQIPAGGNTPSFFPPMSQPQTAGFTWVTSLTGTASDFVNRLRLVIASDPGDPNWQLYADNNALPSTPYVVQGALSFPARAGIAYFDCGIAIRNSGGGQFIHFGVKAAADGLHLRVVYFSSATSVSTIVFDTVGWPIPAGIFFLKIGDDGTTRTYSYSPNGWDYENVFSEASGSFVSPDQHCLSFGNTSGSTWALAFFDSEVNP